MEAGHLLTVDIILWMILLSLSGKIRPIQWGCRKLYRNRNTYTGGSFTSPIINGYTYTFTQRALNQSEDKYDFYYEIEVLNNLLPFKGQTADIIPWFGQVGKGKQTMWKIPIDITTGYQKTWNKLAQEGYVKVTIKKSEWKIS